MLVGDRNARTKVRRHCGDGGDQPGEDPDLIEFGGSQGSSLRLIGLAGHQMFDGPFGSRKCLALFVAVHHPNASGLLCLTGLGTMFDLPRHECGRICKSISNLDLGEEVGPKDVDTVLEPVGV